MQLRNTIEARPLTARSVVASTLLGMQPPRLPGRLLVRSGELFGIAEGTTRVALSRMVAAGELVADDGAYRLAGALLDRQARQEESRQARVRRWDRQWCTAVVTAEGRDATARSALRDAMEALRLAELREGVWLRPDNLNASRLPDARAVADAQCTWVIGRPSVDPAELAGRLWDLEGWAARANELGSELAERLPGLEADDAATLAPAFVTSAAVLRHFQADPLLPPALLPPAWPGADLRRKYDRYDAAFRSVWRAWFRTQGQ